MPGDAESLLLRPDGDFLLDAGVDFGVSNHSVAADLAAPGLKLGLDESDNGLSGLEVGGCGGDNHPKGYEGNVDDDEVDGLGEVEGVAGVELFDDDDAEIVTEFLVELAVSDVDGVDLLRAALEEAVGEAAGGGADVEPGHSRGVDSEGVEGVGQLDAPASYVGETAADF